MDSAHDVVIVGGGHNGLVAAAYLARAGRSVLVLERRPHVGGAAVSQRPWPGVDARLSRYAYLVSLMPAQILADLGLDVPLLRRRVSSYTPVPGAPERGILVDAEGPPPSPGWTRLYDRCATVARAVWPTLTERLPTREELRARVDDNAAWASLFERPIGELVEECLDDDTLRGIALTDVTVELIGHEGRGTHHDFLAVSRRHIVIAIPQDDGGLPLRPVT
jgi:phytoene dehydrogenase-like protein